LLDGVRFYLVQILAEIRDAESGVGTFAHDVLEDVVGGRIGITQIRQITWANLHRVIFTPSNAATAKKFLPLCYYDTDRPEDLWAWLEKTSKETGADFIAIPHNSNMSDGKMFDMIDSDSCPLSAVYTRTRMRWEPVMEITQIKGTSEVHPQLSPDDPLAGFEVRNKLLTGADAKVSTGSYARNASMQGLQLEQSTGASPYKFGMLAATIPTSVSPLFARMISTASWPATVCQLRK